MAEKKRWQRREWMNPEPSRPSLQEPYGEWLSVQPWEWWAIFTFAEWIHPEKASQRYGDWAVALQRAIGFQMNHARALEWQKRGVVHFHSLIWGVHRRTSRMEWEGRWQEIGGGFAAIYPYERQRGAVYYLGKYVVKRGEIDLLTFGPPLPRPDDVRMQRAGDVAPTTRSRT